MKKFLIAMSLLCFVMNIYLISVSTEEEVITEKFIKEWRTIR